MELSTALRTLERLEEKIAELYTVFSQWYADDVEVSSMFLRMSREEMGHRNVVRFERKLLLQGSDCEFAGESIMAQIRNIMHSIDQYIVLSEPPSACEAVQFAIRIEVDAAENHTRKEMLAGHPEIGQLANKLGRADELHVEKLTEFARQRGYLEESVS